MKTFKTSSGYVFKLWEPGERVILMEKGSLIEKGTEVEVLTSPESLSRDVMVLDPKTGKKEQFNCAALTEILGRTYKVKDSNVNPDSE